MAIPLEKLFVPSRPREDLAEQTTKIYDEVFGNENTSWEEKANNFWKKTAVHPESGLLVHGEEDIHSTARSVRRGV